MISEIKKSARHLIKPAPDSFRSQCILAIKLASTLIILYFIFVLLHLWLRGFI